MTPPIDAGLLAGITREFLFEVGRDAGIPVREAVLMDADLFGADEAFLTSSTREVVPIVQVDSTTIGSGSPAQTVARHAVQALKELATLLFHVAHSLGQPLMHVSNLSGCALSPELRAGPPKALSRSS